MKEKKEERKQKNDINRMGRKRRWKRNIRLEKWKENKLKRGLVYGKQKYVRDTTISCSKR